MWSGVNKGKGLSPNWTATVCWLHQVLGILCRGGVGGSVRSGRWEKQFSDVQSCLGISVAEFSELIAHFPTSLVSISLLLGNSQKMWSGSMAKEPVITHHALFYYLYGISRWKSIFSLVFCFLGGNSRRLQRSCGSFSASQWEPALSHPDPRETGLGSALLEDREESRSHLQSWAWPPVPLSLLKCHSIILDVRTFFFFFFNLSFT